MLPSILVGKMFWSERIISANRLEYKGRTERARVDVRFQLRLPTCVDAGLYTWEYFLIKTRFFFISVRFFEDCMCDLATWVDRVFAFVYAVVRALNLHRLYILVLRW
jgi:hypothetical protein